MATRPYERFRDWGGGGGQKKNCAAFLYHSYISKGYYLVGLHKYICILLYSLSYEPILTLLLCTDLYVAIFKLLKSLGWQNIGGGGNCPPPPTPCSYSHGQQLK